MIRFTLRPVVVVGSCTLAVLASCSGGGSSKAGGAGTTIAGDSPTTAAPSEGVNSTDLNAKVCDKKVSTEVRQVTAWFHPGSPGERQVLRAQIDAFNKANPDIQVKLEIPAEKDYPELVTSAAAIDSLPDILNFDGPNLQFRAWDREILPIDTCISPEMKANLIPSMLEKSTYAGKLWGVGKYQGEVALYADKSALAKVGARIPTGPADAWTAQEFTDILAKLKAGGHPAPLGMQLVRGQSEWYTFGFAPMLWSAGTGLVDRTQAPVKATGKLNNDAAVAALTTFQSWFKSGYVVADPATYKGPDPVIRWADGLNYVEFKKLYGDNLVLLPLPRFGDKTVSTRGGWMWGISKNAKDPDASWRFLEYLMQDDSILATVDVNGGIPATLSATPKAPLVQPTGDLHLFKDLLDQGYTLGRPLTPAYPIVTKGFQQAITDIIGGGDVKTILDATAASIDAEIAKNNGFKTVQRPAAG